MTALETKADAEALINKEGIEYVSVRFTDLIGVQQHFTVPASEFLKDAFTDGMPFDGSSVEGFQAINESDMKLVPDVSTAFIDPFRKHKTLDVGFSIVEMCIRDRDPSTGCASNPMTVTLGFVHRRAASEPVPARRYDSTMPASARTVASSISRCRPPTGSSDATPGTAKSPLASYMEEINIAASVFASRIGPPYWPECTGCSNALT